MSLLNLSFLEQNNGDTGNIMDASIDESSLGEFSTTHKEESIPVPNTTTITTKQHDEALGALKKSFKEMASVVELLENARIADDPETHLQQFAESTIDNLIYEACVNGPIYEAVERSDKETVKKLVRKLGNKVNEALADAGVEYRKITTLSKLTHAMWFTTRLWQILGIVYVEAGNIQEVSDKLTEMFKEELGDYKILPYMVGGVTWFDQVALKMNWKNQKGIALLCIDKKLNWPKPPKNDEPKTDSGSKSD